MGNYDLCRASFTYIYNMLQCHRYGYEVEDSVCVCGIMGPLAIWIGNKSQIVWHSNHKEFVSINEYNVLTCLLVFWQNPSAASRQITSRLKLCFANLCLLSLDGLMSDIYTLEQCCTDQWHCNVASYLGWYSIRE